MYITRYNWGIGKIWYNFIIFGMYRYLPFIEETRSRLLGSRFIFCLVATLSRLTAEGLVEEFPPDLPCSFLACVAELVAHGKLKYFSSSMAIPD